MTLIVIWLGSLIAPSWFYFNRGSITTAFIIDLIYLLGLLTNKHDK